MELFLLLALTAALVAPVVALARRLARTGVVGFAPRLAMLTGDRGALTLAEAAKLSTDDLQRGVLETFVLESPILARIPLMTINGNAYAYNEEATLPGVEFRAVNSAYAESTGTVNQRSERLVILGGDADVDTFLVKTRGNVNDLRAEQTAAKVKAASLKFQDAFINGDVAVDANSLDGLRKRLVGAQVVTADVGTTIAGGATEDNRLAFFDLLDDVLSRVSGTPDAIYANKRTIARVSSAARRLTITATPREEFGRSFPTYDGIPLVDLGERADGTSIVPDGEFYPVRFGNNEGDRGVTGLTNGGVDVRDLGEVQDKPVFRTRLEFFCGLAVFGGKAAARLTGVTV